MKYLFFIFFISQILNAQTPIAGNPGEMNSDVLKHEGQFASVRLVLGEPLRIYVVGREEAKFDLSSMKLVVRRIKPYPEKVLETDRLSDYFVISGSDDKEVTELEVTTEVKNKKEIHKFKIKNAMP